MSVLSASLNDAEAARLCRWRNLLDSPALTLGFFLLPMMLNAVLCVLLPTRRQQDVS